MKKEIKDKLMGMKKSELVEIILRKDDVERKNDAVIKSLKHDYDELFTVSESYKDSIDELITDSEEYKRRIEKQAITFGILYAAIYVASVIMLICIL